MRICKQLPLLALALVMVLAACASSQASSADSPQSATPAAQAGVRVVNDAPAFQDVTVFLIPDAGIKRMLGQVRAGETRSFPTDLQAGNYTLEQQRADGTSRSERFYVPGGTSLVIWSLATNRVQVSK